MIGELFFSLIRVAFFFLVFYFFYRLIVSFLRGLKGNGERRPASQPPPQKPVQTYTDVEDAKFKDLPPENKE